MLEKGLHETFTELFEIVREQETRREDAGQYSEVWWAPQLRHQVVTLRFLATHLAEIEAFTLIGETAKVYKGYLSLAYFMRRGHQVDRWLVEYFLSKCVAVTRAVVNRIQNKSLKLNDDSQDLSKLDVAKQHEAEAIYHMAGYLREIGLYQISIYC